MQMEAGAQRRVLAAGGPEVDAETDQRVVLQVGAHAAAVGQHGDAVCAQVLAGADAGAHQQARRVQRAGGDDDLARVDVLQAAVAAHAHADGAASLEAQRQHGGVGEYLQVRA